MSLGNLQYHYKNKEELLSAILNDFLTQYLEENWGERENCSLEQIFLQILTHSSFDSCAIVFKELWSLSTRSDAINGMLDQFYQQTHELFCQLLTASCDFSVEDENIARIVNILLPFFNHNDMPKDEEAYKDDEGFQMIAYGGKGNCFPEVTYQLRKAYVVEAEPVDENHPISKRIHYIDAQTFVLPRNVIYDRKGEMWKSFTIGQSHPDHHLPVNKGTGVSIDDAVTMIDVQANHCTTAQFKGIVDSSLSPPDTFTVQNLRASGN